MLLAVYRLGFFRVDDFHGGFWKIPHFYVQVQRNTKAWLDSGYVLRHLQPLDECRTFSTSRRTRILWLILDPLSIYTQNGKVCSADASVRCFLSFCAAHTWKLGHHFCDLTYLAVRMTDVFFGAFFRHFSDSVQRVSCI